MLKSIHKEHKQYWPDTVYTLYEEVICKKLFAAPCGWQATEKRRGKNQKLKAEGEK
jgi:hypothetical protein